jgi:hypothetical protein
MKDDITSLSLQQTLWSTQSPLSKYLIHRSSFLLGAEGKLMDAYDGPVLSPECLLSLLLCVQSTLVLVDSARVFNLT